MGDLHEVMPSTKNISSLEPLTGFCNAIYDEQHFKFDKADDENYDVKINYTCGISYKEQQILGIDILVEYLVLVQAQSDRLEFMIMDIEGAPIYKEVKGYEIKNYNLANFMVAETLS